MRITKVECIPVTIPFAKPMIMSGGPATQSDAVVLKIHTDEGITGVGETGDTSLWYMGESQESILTNYSRQEMADYLEAVFGWSSDMELVIKDEMYQTHPDGTMTYMAVNKWFGTWAGVGASGRGCETCPPLD